MITGLCVNAVVLLFLFEPCKAAPENPEVSRSSSGSTNHSFGNKASAKLTGIGKGFIVVPGGFGRSGRSSTVHFLDISARTWYTLADFPMSDEGVALFYANGKIFRMGGWDNPAAFMIYDTSYYKWNTLPDLTRPVGGGACVAELNGTIHVIGGLSQGSKTQVANVQSDLTWTVGAPLQQSRYLCGAATLGGHIYVCGHRSVGNDGKTCEKYDPKSNTWSFISPMLDVHEGQILVALGGHLYAVGGNSMGSAEKYDPTMNTWTRIKSMNNPARTFSAAVSDGTLIYGMGGCAGSNICDIFAVSAVEAYVPAVDSWLDVSPMPTTVEDSGALFIPHL